MSARRDPEPELKCPLWMMTFGDCMSLLVTFFVMLIAFSNMEEDQLMDMIGGMKGALGISAGPPSAGKVVMIQNWEKIRGLSETKQWLTVDELSAVIPGPEMSMKRFGRPKIGSISESTIIKMIDEGMAFIINAAPLFDHGKAEITEGNEELLEQIGSFALPLENEIRILNMIKKNSHIASSNYKTPLGLGIERSINLKRALAKTTDIPPERFGIGAQMIMGEVEPNSMESEDHVEIIIIGRRKLEDLTPEQIIIQDKWE